MACFLVQNAETRIPESYAGAGSAPTEANTEQLQTAAKARGGKAGNMHEEPLSKAN